MLQALADTMVLGALLEELRSRCGGAPYELLEHWHQGEFHHDVVGPGRRGPSRAVSCGWPPTATAG